MAILSTPEAVAAKPVSKEAAKQAVDWALDQHSTAKAAADAINESGHGKRFRANHQDSFSTQHPLYKNSGDYAARAKDGRWLVVIGKKSD